MTSVYKYISVNAKPFPLSKILDEHFSGQIFREKELAEAAPEMLEALQKAHSALFLSTPAVVMFSENCVQHRAAYDAVAAVLVKLRELKPIT